MADPHPHGGGVGFVQSTLTGQEIGEHNGITPHVTARATAPGMAGSHDYPHVVAQKTLPKQTENPATEPNPLVKAGPTEGQATQGNPHITPSPHAGQATTTYATTTSATTTFASVTSVTHVDPHIKAGSNSQEGPTNNPSNSHTGSNSQSGVTTAQANHFQATIAKSTSGPGIGG